VLLVSEGYLERDCCSLHCIIIIIISLSLSLLWLCLPIRVCLPVQSGKTTLGVVAVSVCAHEITHDTFTDNGTRSTLDSVLRQLRPVEVVVPSSGLSQETLDVLKRWTMEPPSVNRTPAALSAGGNSSSSSSSTRGASAIVAGSTATRYGSDGEAGGSDDDDADVGDGNEDVGRDDGDDDDSDAEGGLAGGVGDSDGDGDGDGDEAVADAGDDGGDRAAGGAEDVSNLQPVLLRKPDRFVHLCW
jgi:hypothetical protein